MAQSETRSFLHSKSGRGFLVHLAACAALSLIVATGFYYSSLNWFKEHKAEEKTVALRLVDAFVTNYSAVRNKLGPDAPVPATFRAHSIDTFSRQTGDTGFQLRWVGRAGLQIGTGPTDAEMAKTIESFVGAADPQPESMMLDVKGEPVLRTVYPSLAREQSCVDCHNNIQAGHTTWHLNDVMGAFAIDVPMAPFLSRALAESAGLGSALFLALGGIGFGISRVHYRQLLERERTASELSRTRTFLNTVIENMPSVITVKDARTNRYVLMNKKADDIFGIKAEQIIGRVPHEVFPKQFADFVEVRDNAVLRSQGNVDVAEHSIETAAGGRRTLLSKGVVVQGEDGTPHYLLSVTEDITERKQAEHQIAHMAHHDSLTDLPNRVAFAERLNATIHQSVQAERPFAVLCMDLDRFKDVNDVFGHAVGDQLLREVATRLREAAQGAFVARVGGDEFVLITDLGEQPSMAEALAERLHVALAEEINIEGHRVRAGLTVGVAIFPSDGDSATALIANGDAALYRAKSEGRGQTRFFEAEMDQRLRERRVLQDDLRNAVERSQLELHYQPQALMDGTIIGFEALARWRHSTRGFVSPSEFIPIAEESNLILDLGEWALRAACREAATWPNQLYVAVNVSAVQFRHGDLPGLIHAILLDTGLSASRLEVEITESVLIDDLPRALSTLRRLKSLGIRIAMDDFGTGYSSLSNLQSFSFDKIKIDRSFITNLKQNPQSATIVRAVIGLGRGLDVPVVAEGVETAEQLAFLASESCSEVQGYWIGKPLPIEDYAETVGRMPVAATARLVG
jgi:diguanylate cyclase (GGDEF)-like protein/PAS domain S-box-containing protein